MFFCWRSFFFLLLFFLCFFLYDCFNKNFYFVKYFDDGRWFLFFQTFVTAIVWSTSLFIFICNCEIDGIYKKNDLDFSCSDKMESELSYHDFDESCESIIYIYIYIWRMDYIYFGPEKIDRDLYSKNGIVFANGYNGSFDWNCLNSCFSRFKKVDWKNRDIGQINASFNSFQ